MPLTKVFIKVLADGRNSAIVLSFSSSFGRSNPASQGVRMLFEDVSEAHLELADKRDIYPKIIKVQLLSTGGAALFVNRHLLVRKGYICRNRGK